MAEKKIVVNISNSGSIDAETFGMHGIECVDALDKLLKDLALESNSTKKDDYYNESRVVSNEIKVNK